jgi:hypothetical protein
MEVHAHTHTARKKWTHYFWEFLMLFLAVFCGFLAEYQLEHKIEKDREKQFMKSMIEDLKKDTAKINIAVSGNRNFVNGLDTLLNILSYQNPDKKQQRQLLIYTLKYTYWYMTVEFSELTLSQLKYSGGFRLIKNQEVANDILQYDQGMEACKFNYNILLNYYHINETTIKELFNMKLARKTFKFFEEDFANNYLPVSEIEKLVDDGNYLDKKNPELLSRYHDDLLYYQTTLSNLNGVISVQKKMGDSLIRLIRKKYQITD